jgi:hypothetical protein
MDVGVDDARQEPGERAPAVRVRGRRIGLGDEPP